MRIESCEDAVVTLDFNPFFLMKTKNKQTFSPKNLEEPQLPLRERERGNLSVGGDGGAGVVTH
jgi:hypothetical protein